MSESIFLSKNGVQSSTSDVPTWMNDAKNLRKDILTLTNKLQQGGKKTSKKVGAKKASKVKAGSKKGTIKVSELLAKVQPKKSSKKASKNVSKKVTKKSSKSVSKKVSKKPTKKTSKSVSKKPTKKSSKNGITSKKLIETILKGGAEPKKTSKSGSTRSLPLAIIKGNEFKEHVQKDMKLKGGPLLMTFSYMIWNEFKELNKTASPDELFKGAMKLYNDYKKQGKLESMYKDAEKKYEAKRAAKKNSK